jgi:hypothetical protein
MSAMLKWVITCGHHVVLRDLVRDSPQAVAALLDQRRFHDAIYGHLTHLALIGSDLRVIDLVAAHAGVPPLAISRAARSGSLQALELLVRHFVDHHAGLLSERTSADTSIETTGPITEELLDQLDQALMQGGLSVARLFLLSGTHTLLGRSGSRTRAARLNPVPVCGLLGEGGHVGLMRPLLERSNAARRHKLLMTITNRKGNTGALSSVCCVCVCVCVCVRQTDRERERESVILDYRTNLGLWAREAFLEACDTGCAEVFAFLFPLLSDDQIRTAANQQRMTGLLLALRRGDVDMARAFLDRGASANGDRPLGPLPLAVAVAVRPLCAI